MFLKGQCSAIRSCQTLWEALAAVCTSFSVNSQTETDRCTVGHPRCNELLSHTVQENQAPGKVAIADNHKGKAVLCRLTCNLLVLVVVSDGDDVWRLVVLACACQSLIAQWMDECAAICFCLTADKEIQLRLAASVYRPATETADSLLCLCAYCVVGGKV